MRSRRVPTLRQYRRLLVLASGAMVIAPCRRDFGSLLRRGWVAPEAGESDAAGLPPLRITPAGLRALADAVERYGLPEVACGGGGRASLSEHSEVARRRRERDGARADLAKERDRLGRIDRALLRDVGAGRCG